MAPSFSHGGTESTGAQGVDGLTVIVEVKAARALDPVFVRQLLTYVKIMNLRLGLVMNFGMATRKAGIRRIAN
jgi:iron complex transport system substrate-binding protein